jgi:cation diffusion facilitator family transporter
MIPETRISGGRTGEERSSGDMILRVAVFSLGLNILLVLVKLWLSVLSGSLALRADAIHSMVDIFASVALILGLRIATRKDARFPYGLYKVENVVSVLISFLVFLTAYELLLEALGSGAAAETYSGWILLAVGLLIPVPYLFGRYQVAVGERLNSPSLIADGSQHKTDVLSSTVVFFAVLGQYFGIPLDRYAAVIIAAFIAAAGWGILKNGMKVLLDASIDHETLDEIRAIILADPAVTGIRQVTGRNSGRYIFIEAVVVVRLTDLERAHLTSDRIEQAIRSRVENVERVIIHYEPKQKTRIRYAVGLRTIEGEISMHFGESPYFAILQFNLVEGGLEKQETLTNRHIHEEKGKGIKVAEMLLAHKPDCVVVGESLEGKGPGYALHEAGVEVRVAQETTLAAFIERTLREISCGRDEPVPA